MISLDKKPFSQEQITTVTLINSCVSLLPLSPLALATYIPMIFFGMHDRVFIIFCSSVLYRFWEEVSFAVHEYKMSHQQIHSYHQQPLL